MIISLFDFERPHIRLHYRESGCWSYEVRVSSKGYGTVLVGMHYYMNASAALAAAWQRVGLHRKICASQRYGSFKMR